MIDIHTRVAERANAVGIMVTPAAVADIARWLAEERFTPFTGFIPGDGDDDRTTLSRSNPLCQHPQHRTQHGREVGGVGRGLHGSLDT